MRQDKDTRSQLHRNFDALRSLLFTKEYINTGFGIWDAGMSRPDPVTSLLFNCVLVVGLTNTIIRVVLLESQKFRELDLQS